MNHRSSARILLALFIVALFPAFGRHALAQDTGFAIDRFDRAEAGSDWFVGESLDLRGHVRPAIGLVGDFANEPLMLYDARDEEYQALVQNQLHLHLGASLVLLDRLRFGLNVPLVVTQSGDPGSVPGSAIAYSGDTSLGDIRLGADVRLAGDYGSAFTLAAGLQAYLPSGSRDAYSGDGAVRVAPRLMIAGDIAAFAYSARVAYAYRAQDDGIGDVPTGSELGFVVTAGARFGNFLIGPEFSSTTVLDAAFEKTTTPAEIILGGHYAAGDLRFDLGGGTGFTRGIGSPSLRLLAAIEWAPQLPPEPEPVIEEVPPPPPPDRDADGIVDAQDACVDVKGEASSVPERNGCPPDRDDDGVVDSQDACIDEAGVANGDPAKNGCPPDSDFDGVYDAFDRCPTQPGAKSDDPTKNGCPRDSDGDSILDAEDACPEAVGERNADPEKNGCPIARVEKDEIKITERIEFKSNSSKLLPASTPVLDAVLAILKEHPEIGLVSLDGFTDNVGKPKYNLKLSQQRTEAVRRWLVLRGIEKARLEAHGHGQEDPIADNDTDEGREKNRRVEFHIKQQQESAPAPAPAPSSGRSRKAGGGADMVIEEAQ